MSLTGASSDKKARILRARIGGYALAAAHDPLEYTLAARQTFLRRFYPDDPNLAPAEAERRAQAGLKAHMAKLALASAKARRRHAQNGGPS